jgi:hypothetical protein
MIRRVFRGIRQIKPGLKGWFRAYALQPAVVNFANSILRCVASSRGYIIA